MTKQQLSRLISIEGRRVNVALRDGSRIDDCQLVSSGRNRVTNMWLYWNGTDIFVPLADVLDVWESDLGRARAA
ncbi:MAG: hypothetical protein JWL83_1774 [Actinomycetia bacterium]|nr:hypothetical protein [Actinomycetes bacterium]